MKSKKIFTIFLLFLINVTELTTYGNVMLLINENENETLINKLKSFSTILYLASTVLSQLSFNLFSGMVVVAGPISEVSVMINHIMTMAYKNNPNFLFDGLTVVFLSTVLFATISFLSVPQSRYLRMLPFSVCNGIMVGTGIMQFEIPRLLLQPPLEYYLLLCAIVFLIYFLEKISKINNISFFCAFLFSLLFFFLEKEKKIKKKDFYGNKIDFIGGFALLKEFPLEIHWSFLLRMVPNILFLAFFCFLQLPANLLAYESMTKKSCSFRNELLAQSMANFICSVSVFPVYFICQSSIFLLESKMDSCDAFFLIFVFLMIFPVLNLVMDFVPLFVQSFFPLLVGYQMVIDYSLDAFNNSYFDLLITLSVALMTIWMPMVIAFILGLLLTLVLKGICTYKFGKSSLEIEKKEFIFVKINNFAFFTEENEFVSLMKEERIIVDLRKCFYYDMNIRNVFFRMHDATEVIFIGKNIVGLNFAEDYEDALTKFY